MRRWSPPSRSSLLCCALLPALLGTGCGEADEQPIGPQVPIRLLGAPEEKVGKAIASDSFAGEHDLSSWHVLDFLESSLTPAASADSVEVESPCLVFKATGKALVRLVELLPGESPVSVHVEMDRTGEYVANEPLKNAAFVHLTDLAEGETIQDVLERGVVEVRGVDEPLTRTIDRRLRLAMRRGQFRWSAAPDSRGIAEARTPSPPRENRGVWALVLPTVGRTMHVASFSVSPLKLPTRELRRNEDAWKTVVDASAAQQVRINGEVRTALVLQPGTTATLPFRAPANTEQLSFGVALADGTERNAATRWKAELRTEDERIVLEDKVLLQPRPDKAGYDDAVYEWPFAKHTEGVIHFECDGDAALVIGSPRLFMRKRTTIHPNLLFISIDTLRADHLGSYGYQRPTSPFLDRFAARSARFENYLSVAPYTLPTHATMFTGLFPPRHGAVDEVDRLDSSRVSYLPSLLAEKGYVTSGFTASGFLSEDFGFADGFDRYTVADPITIEDDVEVHDRLYHRRRRDLTALSRWIDDNQGRHWFAFVHTFLVHEYMAPDSDVAKFDTGPERKWEGPLRDHIMNHGSWLKDPPGPGDVQHAIDLYDATIHYCDRMLARLFERLDDGDLLRNTVVVITSDHGEEFWEHGGLRHSITVYDEMLRVPLMIRVPGGGPGREVGTPTSQADLMPTILDLLGIDAPEGLDGRSRAALVRGQPDREPPTPLFAHVETRNSRRASLQVGENKLIQGDRSEHLRYPADREWELYSIREDRGEQNDLVGQEPKLLKQLKSALSAVRALIWAGAVEGKKALISDKVLKELEELGYINGG